MAQSRRAFTWRKFWLDTHIYSNLLCAGYLVIYGLTSLAFNHGYRPDDSKVEWSRPVEAAPASSDLILAESVRDELKLIGWVPERRIRRQAPDVLQFRIIRPAKAYDVRLDQAGGIVEVIEIRSGIVGALSGLHGLGKIPNSTWSLTWAIYTELSIVALLYAVVSGFVIWWMRAAAQHHRWLLLLSTAGTLLLIASIIR